MRYDQLEMAATNSDEPKYQTMKNETELREQLENAHSALRKIEDARQRKANRKYLGKCFRYENSYGDKETWPLYLRVTKTGRYMQAHKFEKTSMGIFQTQNETYLHGLDGWTEISRAEFDAAWQNFLRELKALNS